MSEQCCDILRCDPGDLKQAMSIHTRKITDSCRDKDCIEELRVYLTVGSQAILDTCANTRVRSAELLFADMDVQPVAFDRMHYCIDITFYYRILADAVIGTGRPASLYGLAQFSKRAVLCGENSRAHTFRSGTLPASADILTGLNSNLPTAVVEALDPMVLGSRVREVCDCGGNEPTVVIPPAILGLFDEELVLSGDRRRLFVTLGQFSIVRLEREAQLVVPVLDYSIPAKECCDNPGSAEDPCEMFSRIPFPAQEFSPQCCDSQNSGGYQTTC